MLTQPEGLGAVTPRPSFQPLLLLPRPARGFSRHVNGEREGEREGRQKGRRETGREEKSKGKKKKTKKVSNPTIISQIKKLLCREGKTLALSHMCTEGLHQNQPQRLLQLFLAPHNVNCSVYCCCSQDILGSLHSARKPIQPWRHRKSPVPLPHPTQCQHCWR